MAVVNTRAIVLAAGRSTRFKTSKSKLLTDICGQAMILYPLKELAHLGLPTTLVLGHQSEPVQKEVEAANLPNIDFIIQHEQLGTGHAVACTEGRWDKDQILVLSGDTPLITSELIQRILITHSQTNAAITFYSTFVIDPTGYGRVLSENGKLKIIEEKDCTHDQKNINQVNAGIYVFSRKFLKENIQKIEKSSITGEFYLPELVALAEKQNLTVVSITAPFDSIRGINILEELWAVEQIKRSQLIKHWMANGVRFELAQNIHIDRDVEIGADSFIGTGVILSRGTKIGKNCKINAFTVLENTIVGDDTVIHSHTVLQDSVIGKNCNVGPFARLRDEVLLGNKVTVGNFVEIKNSSLGDGVKAKHLTFLGDAQIGSAVNIGAGTITCNHDGKNKNQTIIEKNAYIGSNSSLIAPVQIGEGAFTAAGSVITKNVGANDLAIGRAQQVNKPGYATILRERAAAKKAALDAQKKNSEIPQQIEPAQIINQETETKKRTVSSSSSDEKNSDLQFIGAYSTEAGSRL